MKHIFNHSAGVPGYDPPIPFATQYDWEAITQTLARQDLWWEPGTQRLAKAVPRLIPLDLMIPVMDGFELVVELPARPH